MSVGLLFAFVAITFAVLVVVGVVLLVRTGSGHAGSSAMRILEERYARGEIDRDEFIRRRDDLRA